MKSCMDSRKNSTEERFFLALSELLGAVQAVTPVHRRRALISITGRDFTTQLSWGGNGPDSSLRAPSKLR